MTEEEVREGYLAILREVFPEKYCNKEKGRRDHLPSSGERSTGIYAQENQGDRSEGSFSRFVS